MGRILFLLLSCGSLAFSQAGVDVVLKNAKVTVFFSPDGGAAQGIVDTLARAKETVVVQAYSFTSAPIAKALKDAHARGVNVQVILDKSQRTERYSGFSYLQHAGVPVRIDAQHKINHNKVIVVDNRWVITGSYNFTKSAESENAENLLIVDDPTLARIYTTNWLAHAAHSEP